MPAHIPGRVSTQVRLDRVAWEKTKAIGKLENRNANAQLDYFMKMGVAAYEKEHGEIKIEPA